MSDDNVVKLSTFIANKQEQPAIPAEAEKLAIECADLVISLAERSERGEVSPAYGIFYPRCVAVGILGMAEKNGSLDSVALLKDTTIELLAEIRKVERAMQCR